MSLWLTDGELIELTGYRQRERQKRALARMGVQFRSRDADGFPLVARSQFTGETTPGYKGRKVEPNYGAA